MRLKLYTTFSVAAAAAVAFRCHFLSQNSGDFGAHLGSSRLNILVSVFEIRFSPPFNYDCNCPGVVSYAQVLTDFGCCFFHRNQFDLKNFVCIYIYQKCEKK
jgi:hypothetical protein